MTRSLCRSVTCALAATLAWAAAAVAQSTITQWNFNGASQTTPSSGSGTITLLAPLTPQGSVSGTGSSDTGVPNNAYNTSPYPAATMGNGTAGIEFAVSTANFTDILVTTDMRWSNTASRFVKFQYSTDGGMTYVDGPNALITGPGNTTFVNNINSGFNLTGVPGVANNANFRFRFVAVFDPAGTAYVANNPASTYATSGTIRYDMVTVTGTALVSTPPTGGGSALPAGVCRGNGSVTLTVITQPGQNPTSNTINVSGDLTSIGGPMNAVFNDQGGGVFTFVQPIDNSITVGTKNISFAVSDDFARSTTGSIAFEVADCAPSTTVVISQVYGGGGNFGPPESTYTHDFVELFNLTNGPIDLSTYSVQYGSAAGAFNQRTNLTGIIPARGYYLVQMAAGTSGTQPLPTPDQIGTIALGATAGKVALVNNQTNLNLLCVGPSVVDLVSYGTGVSCQEGSFAAPPGSNTTAVLRLNNGCQDTNSNLDDFAIGTPTPRNSASPTNNCIGTGPTLNDGNVSITSTGCPGDSVSISVSGIVLGNPVANITSVVIDASSIGAGSINLTESSPGVYSGMTTIAPATTFGAKLLPVTVNDALMRSGSANGNLTVVRCQPSAGQSLDPRAVCATGGSVRALVFPTLATANPPSAGVATVIGDFSGVGGPNVVNFSQELNGTAWIAEDIAIGANSAASYTIPYTLTDLEGRTFNGTFTLPVVDCVAAPAGVRISQIFGGGGNSTQSGGAPFQNDYVELFNATNAAVDMTGWSLQFASATGNFSNKTDLVGSIQPGGYFLIQLQAGIGCNGFPCGDPLPTPDQTDAARFLGASSGKVALVNTTTLIGNNFSDPSIVDLVGYGGNANGFEGGNPASGPNDVRALFRDGGGCVDNNQNGADLRTAAALPRNSASPSNSCAADCFVDFNDDGFLNQEDLGGFLTAFLDESVPPGPSGTNLAPCPGQPAPYDTLGFAADYNRDCNFDQEDLGGYITEFFTESENPLNCIPG